MGVPVDLSPTEDLVAGLAARLGITLTDPVDIARAQAAVDDALGLAQDYTRQSLTLVEGDTVTLAQPSGYDRVLYLPELPIGEVSAVSIGVTPVLDWVPTVGGIYRYWGWRQFTEFTVHAPPTVTVTYSHGYAVLPAGLRAVLLSMALLAWENPVGRKQVRQGETAITYELSALPAGTIGPGHMATLNRYRRVERSTRLHNPLMFR